MLTPTYAGTIQTSRYAQVAFTVSGPDTGMPVLTTAGSQIGILVDDTDPNRAADVRRACKQTRIVLVTVGQGEPANTLFHCPPPARAYTLREWYPYWNGRQQLPWSWFPCNHQGWVAQAPGWAWGGYASDTGTGPGATYTQYRAEERVLSRRCPAPVQASFGVV